MIVDIHGHVTPPELLKRYPMPPALGDIEGMIEQKARAGVDLTIVGSPVGAGTMMPTPERSNFSQSREELKSLHDWLAETVAHHWQHLRAYAYVNPFGDDRALHEVAETLTAGKFVGFIVNSSIEGVYLDSPRADAFFAMVDELQVPVFLHPPAEPVGTESFEDWRLVEHIARFNDVTAGLTAIVFGGRLEQYPRLEVIAATGGGAISLLGARLDTAFRAAHGAPGGPPMKGGDRPPGSGGGGPPDGGPPMARFANKITRPPSEYLSRIYVDTANMSRTHQMANLETMSPTHLLFGTDSPPVATPIDLAMELITSLPISDEDRADILGDNACRLFNLNAPGA